MHDMIFNGVDISAHGVVESIRRPLSAAISNTLTSIPGRDGMRFLNSTRNQKTIEVDFRIIGGSREAVTSAVESVKPLVISHEPKRLTLRDYPTRYDLAILDGSIDFERFMRTGFASLTFVAPEGVMFDLDETSGTTNTGTAKTPWTLKGTFTSGATISITNLTTLQKVTIDASGLTAGSRIEINFEHEHVYVNDVLSMNRVYFDSDFWWLSPGENPYTSTGLTVTDAKHRRRWL